MACFLFFGFFFVFLTSFMYSTQGCLSRFVYSWRHPLVVRNASLARTEGQKAERRGCESEFSRFIVDIKFQSLQSALSWIFITRSWPVGRLSWALLHLPSQSSKPKLNDQSIALVVLSLHEECHSVNQGLVHVLSEVKSFIHFGQIILCDQDGII